MSASDTLTKPEPTNEYRLPTNVKPSHYDLTIQTDLDNSVFKGLVKINLDVKEPTSTIVLNSSKLKLDKAYVRSDTLNEKLAPSDCSVNDKDKQVTFTFPTTFQSGTQLELEIAFTGTFDGSNVGYYRASYEKDGEKRYYTLTQFEAINARCAFPCWDEPALKATFDVTLISKTDMVNISNSAVVLEKAFSPNDQDYLGLKEAFPTLNDKWKITKFHRTPKMSTYIVAFASGPFEYIESKVKLPISGMEVPLRVYATADIIHQAQFALDVKAQVLPLYEQLFDVPYPLPKLDTLVAADLDAGAMENWGLITGRTSELLLDPMKGDTIAKKSVIETQAHEVAHMWFGNMTTMEWWDYLYLNEGFATLLGSLIAVDRLFPEYKGNADFIVLQFEQALALDAKPSSHPIEVSCPNAESIGQIFDSLSYSKAASVLRMLSAYVGEDKFLKGVSLYLKDHMYGNTVTGDLWKGIGQATGLDIPRLMDNWVTKTGFPVVTITETSNSIKMRQDRFLETGIAEGKENETIWNIPLSILTVGSSGKTTIDRDAILDTREKEFPLDTSKPFKINADTNGVYRVLYTDERLSKIAAEIAKSDCRFSLEDKMGLINDAMALSQAALMKLSTALTLIDAMRHEEEYFVWKVVSDKLSEIASVWRDHTEIKNLLNEFRRSLFSPIVKKLGYTYSTEDSADTNQLRTSAIGVCAVAEDTTIVNELRSRFEHYMKTGDDSKIPADLQRIIYATAVKHGGRDEFHAVKAISDKPPTPTAKISAMLALGYTQDDSLLRETLNIMLNEARDQDVAYFFLGLAVHHHSNALLIDTFKEKYDQIYARFAESFVMYRLVEFTFKNLSTDENLRETVAFFKNKDVSRYSMALDQTLDGIQARIAYRKHSSLDILVWLREWKQKNL